MDFVWGTRATEEIYFPIIDIINQDLNITSKEVKTRNKLERMVKLHKKLIKMAKFNKLH